jgi:hypothetical protein
MLVSQYVAFGSVPDLGLHQDDDDDTDENAMPSTWFPFDNTSNNYCHNSYWSSGSPNYGDSNATCPRTTLLWSILRGMKRILARVANSYYAMPVVLFVMPLLIGLVVGICLGRRWERNMERMHRDKQPTMKSRRGRLRTFQQKVPWLWHWLWSLAPLQWIIPTRLNQEKESTVGANNDKALSEAATTTNTSTTTLDQTIDKESSVIVVDEEKDELARARLRREEEYETRESGVALELVPKHVAVIMDGNRRYGRAKYHNATQGHRDGSERLVDFAKWCCIEGVQVLTVFAFSTENWQRDPSEVAALMQLFCQYCDELRVEALQRNIQLRVLSSDETKVKGKSGESHQTVISLYIQCSNLTISLLPTLSMIDTCSCQGGSRSDGSGNSALPWRFDHEHLSQLRQSGRDIECLQIAHPRCTEPSNTKCRCHT